MQYQASGPVNFSAPSDTACLKGKTAIITGGMRVLAISWLEITHHKQEAMVSVQRMYVHWLKLGISGFDCSLFDWQLIICARQGNSGHRRY